LLSGFLDKHRYNGAKEKYGQFDLTPCWFRGFVTWLEDGGIVRDSHWDLQIKLMLLPLEKYSYVFRFESLRNDMKLFLSKHEIHLKSDRLNDLYPSDASKKISFDPYP